MRFFGLSAATCLISFILAGVFYNFADFSSVKEQMKNKSFQKGFSFNFDLEEGGNLIEKNFTFSSAEVVNIKIDSRASDILIESAEVKDISLTVKMEAEVLEKDFLAEISDEVLTISDRKDGEEYSDRNFSLFGASKIKGSKIKIKIPQGFTASYDFNVDFGEIKIIKISGNKMNLNFAAGDVDIKNSSFNEFYLKAAAGDIDLIEVEVGEGVIKAAAGDINLVKVKSKREFLIKAAAGDIDVEMNQPKPFVKIKASAGDIDFSLTEGNEYNFTVKNSTSVGSLRVKGGATKENGDHIYGKGEGLVEIKTSFGDVKIK